MEKNSKNCSDKNIGIKRGPRRESKRIKKAVEYFQVGCKNSNLKSNYQNLITERDFKLKDIRNFFFVGEGRG